MLLFGTDESGWSFNTKHSMRPLPHPLLIIFANRVKYELFYPHLSRASCYRSKGERLEGSTSGDWQNVLRQEHIHFPDPFCLFWILAGSSLSNFVLKQWALGQAWEEKGKGNRYWAEWRNVCRTHWKTAIGRILLQINLLIWILIASVDKFLKLFVLNNCTFYIKLTIWLSKCFADVSTAVTIVSIGTSLFHLYLINIWKLQGKKKPTLLHKNAHRILPSSKIK